VIASLVQTYAEIFTSTWHWLYLFFVVMAAGFIRGLSGFGFSALCFFALSPILPPIAIVPLMFVLECSASLHLITKVWSQVPWRWLWYLSLGSFIGTPIGIMAIAIWQPELVRGIAGTAILVAAVALLYRWRLKSADHKSWLLGVGLLSGLANGLASIGGSVIAVYILSSSISLVAMRAALIVFFLIIDTYGLVWFAQQGFLHVQTFILAITVLPVMLLANHIGFNSFDRLKEPTKRRIAIFLLMILATLAIADALAFGA